MQKFIRFLKDWTLAISIVMGMLAYFAFATCPLFDGVRPYAEPTVAIVQPTLLFLMLFFTFCKISVRDLRLRRWHGVLLATQLLCFAATAAAVLLMPQSGGRVIMEAAMLCFICPTATASAVVTTKLRGDAAGITTYLVIINIAVAVCFPLIVPIIHPETGSSFVPAFLLILAKVFPTLILPFISAQLVREFLPGFVRRVAAVPNLVFYLWAVSLALAIAVTTRIIVHSDFGLAVDCCIALSSLIACAVQFFIGRKIGIRYGSRIAACQAFGQKNTTLAIWMGYTFLTPATSIAGGFYSIWHNVYNSWQLYKENRRGDNQL